jgi:hypothetical protein
MSRLVTTVGWLGFAGGLIYFVIQDRSGAPNYHYIETTQHIFVISGAVVLSGYLLKYLSRILGLGSNRCRACGKRIERQEMYCFDHRLEAIRKAQEEGRLSGPPKH